MGNRFLFAAAAAALVATSAVAATYATTNTWYVFTTVDAFQRDGQGIRVTGVLQGEAAATEITFRYYNSSTLTGVPFDETCERAALMAMSKPGQYVLSVFQGSTPSTYCKLARAVP